MAKIDRFNGNYQAFASDAENAKRTVFNTTTTGVDSLTTNMNSDYFLGWEIVTSSDYPTLQDFNAAFFTSSQTLAYLHQMGIPEWNSKQEFHDGSYATDPNNGNLYRCTTDSHTSSTPPRNDSTNWTLPDASDADTVDGLDADSFMRRDTTPKYTNLNGVYENIVFRFDNDATGAIGTGTSYDAVGISLNSSDQRTQIASSGYSDGMFFRHDDGSGFGEWTQFFTHDDFEDEWSDNDLTSADGYRKCPDGYIEQWGQTGAIGSTDGQYYNFGFNFTECVNVQVTSMRSGGEGGFELAVGLISFDNSGFTFATDRVDGSGTDTITVLWRAIGR